MPSVSPGELVSGCNPPGRCQPSRIPGSLGYKLEACSQFGRRCCLSGRVCPFPALAGALLPPTSSGGWVSPQPASSALVFAQSLALWVAGSALGEGFSQDRSISFLSLSLAIPQSALLSHVTSLTLNSGHSGLVLTLSNAALSSPFIPHSLVADASVWATSLLGVALRHVICGFSSFLSFYLFYLFSPPSYAALWDSKTAHRPRQWESFLVFGNFSSLKTHSLGWASIPNSFVSLFIFYLSSYLLLKTMGCLSGCLVSSSTFRSCFVEFAQHSNVLSMNLWGRKWSPILFHHHLRTPPPKAHLESCVIHIVHLLVSTALDLIFRKLRVRGTT